MQAVAHVAKAKLPVENSIMECFGFCTASTYALKPLFEMLRTQYKATLYRDVIHVEWQLDDQSIDFFFFSFGTAVSWGADRKTSLNFIQQIKPYEDQPYEDFENSDECTYRSDEFTYIYAKTTNLPKLLMMKFVYQITILFPS